MAAQQPHCRRSVVRPDLRGSTRAPPPRGARRALVQAGQRVAARLPRPQDQQHFQEAEGAAAIGHLCLSHPASPRRPGAVGVARAERHIEPLGVQLLRAPARLEPRPAAAAARRRKILAREPYRLGHIKQARRRRPPFRQSQGAYEEVWPWASRCHRCVRRNLRASFGLTRKIRP